MKKDLEKEIELVVEETKKKVSKRKKTNEAVKEVEIETETKDAQEAKPIVVEEPTIEEALKKAEPIKDEMGSVEKPLVENKPIDEEKKTKTDSPKKKNAEPKEKVENKTLADFGGVNAKGVEAFKAKAVVINNKIADKYDDLRKKGEVIWARVVGSELDKKMHSVAIVCLLDDGQRALIPDCFYFMPDTKFDEGYENQSDSEKAKIRQKLASYQMGAIVCFTIFSVSRDEKMGLTIFGNRVDAMNKLQDFYFTHKNYPQTKENTIAVGDKTKARVLTVRSHKLFVECCGIETFLSPYYLSNETITNCKNLYKSGDVIDVEIRKMYTEPKNYLSLTSRFSITKEKAQQIIKGSTYLGTVERIDGQKGTISIRLTNGLNVSVLRNKIVTVDPKTLAKGDRVVVEVTKVLDEFAQGFIIAKC